MGFFTNVPFSIEMSIALEIGIITIFTIFFSFAGIKSNLQSEFKDKIELLREQYKNKVSKANLDYIVSKLNQKHFYLGTLLTISGQTFRICIYFGIFSILILGVYEYLKWVILFHLFLMILLLQFLGLYQNVHRFKEFYELDLEREFHKEKSYLELIQRAFNIKDYDFIGQFSKKEKGIFRRFFMDVRSLLRFKI